MKENDKIICRPPMITMIYETVRVSTSNHPIMLIEPALIYLSSIDCWLSIVDLNPLDDIVHQLLSLMGPTRARPVLMRN